MDSYTKIVDGLSVTAEQECDNLRTRLAEVERELGQAEGDRDSAWRDLEKIVSLCGDPSEKPSESVARVVARLATLEAALPTDEERRWIGAALSAARLYAAGMHITEGEPLVPPNTGEFEMRVRCAERWLARFDAARAKGGV